jgi:asparagine synthase (glutamine-hydrolysing)
VRETTTLVKDTYDTLLALKTNMKDIQNVLAGWFKEPLLKRKSTKTYSPDDYQEEFKGHLAARYNDIGNEGKEIHKMLLKSNQVLKVSKGAPTWRAYVDFINDIVIDGQDRDTAITDKTGWPEVPDFTHRMMHLDMETYLPGDILTKVDRAAMGVSLEGRIPLLDQHLIEFAWTIPTSMKVRNDQGKWLMRQALYRHVPQKLIDRPKRGFGVPMEHWLRSELRDWADDLLSESRLKREGYFHPAPIRQKWQEHLSGTRNWHFYLWDILMFQAWLNRPK